MSKVLYQNLFFGAEAGRSRAFMGGAGAEKKISGAGAEKKIPGDGAGKKISGAGAEEKWLGSATLDNTIHFQK